MEVVFLKSTYTTFVSIHYFHMIVKLTLTIIWSAEHTLEKCVTHTRVLTTLKFCVRTVAS